MVYVLNKNGQVLMPTNRYGKVRRLLKSNKAKVIKRCPFTIQLMYDSSNHTQPNKEYAIFGRRQTGFFDIRTLDGVKVNKGSVSYKKLKYIESQNNYLIERRDAVSLTTKVVNLPA